MVLWSKRAEKKLEWLVADGRRRVGLGNEGTKDKGFEKVRRLRHLMKLLKTKNSRTSRLKHPGFLLDILIRMREVE